MNTQDTIAAIATPIGSAGIGVIRISGPQTFAIIEQVFSGASKMLSHTARHGTLVEPISKEPIDDVVVTAFQNPKSYTGEDVVEISCHGGIAVLKSVLGAVLRAGARLAEPGEYTKRAFLNGKIDLTQAEAVNDLIRASTDGARKVALRQLDGKLSQIVKDINHKILGVIAAVEAAIDFPDDVEEPKSDWLVSQISTAMDEIKSLLGSSESGRIYREGLRVVIAGQVNVGKSSLLNALLRHARAIVTPIPGTTRDVIEESLEIHGVPIVAIDTAGVRTTDDPIEKIGVELTEKSIISADLVLLVIDASSELNEDDMLFINRLEDKPMILVLNKIDLLNDQAKTKIAEKLLNIFENKIKVVATSASSGIGIDKLENEIASIASKESGSESILVSNIRHKSSLESAENSLAHALNTIHLGRPIDFLGVDLLAARNSLGLVTGETASEDLLDRIFSEFCIGK